MSDPEHYEGDLMRQPTQARIDLWRRTPERFRLGYADWERTAKRAIDAGLDPDPVHKILLAAEAGFDWDDTVRLLRVRGMDKECAEEAAEMIACNILACQSIDRAKGDSRRSRDEIRNLLIGAALFFIVAAAAVIYWPSWYVSAVSFVRQCFAT